MMSQSAVDMKKEKKTAASSLFKKNVKKFMKLVYPKEFLIQASIALIAVSIGYYMRVMWVNIMILFFLFLWCAYSNKELARTIVEPILNRLGRKYEK